MTPFVENLVLRRGAALLLLGAALLAIVPPVVSSVDAWRLGQETVAEERRILDRLVRLEARRDAVLEAARGDGPAPFLVAADAGEALAALSERAVAAAPSQALRIQTLEPVANAAESERPGAPVGLRVRFEATPSGLYAFLRELEEGRPAIRIGELATSVSSLPGADVVLSGAVELRAAFLVRERLEP